jgi:hypothetical protein
VKKNKKKYKITFDDGEKIVVKTREKSVAVYCAKIKQKKLGFSDKIKNIEEVEETEA